MSAITGTTHTLWQRLPSRVIVAIALIALAALVWVACKLFFSKPPTPILIAPKIVTHTKQELSPEERFFENYHKKKAAIQNNTQRTLLSMNLYTELRGLSSKNPTHFTSIFKTFLDTNDDILTKGIESQPRRKERYTYLMKRYNELLLE